MSRVVDVSGTNVKSDCFGETFESVQTRGVLDTYWQRESEDGSFETCS